MEFTTKINIPPSSDQMTHTDGILMSGSCFTENIGNFLNNYLFDVHINPFGIVYNPVSIFDGLHRIANGRIYTEQDLLKQQDLYISLDHHGRFSGTDREEVLTRINDSIRKAHQHFLSARYIILTLGSAFIYRHLALDKIVANCHKIPNTQFEKRLLEIEEIVAAFHKIQPVLNGKKVIFTISPVRHWRDGAVENQHSKSILTESVRQILEEQEHCSYFPAYEIMMDELRDYRFYAEDMLHPNAVAVKYIWERFAETFFSEETTTINKRIEKINLLRQHRVKNKDTREQEDFNALVKKSIDHFKADYPAIPVKF